ncbi:MAG: DUF3426 domain-containing protein [Betaproteobacteria bacterium HGW-Betaproteobacteria-22]|nr:MAG: DUF3426 domain-containing protein [Betaproteobacteria bacterium HGW-Betaproteobacteria-22]
MRNITRCPNCQTEFFVSEAQLTKHGGLVRCGQCLKVFDAKSQFIHVDTAADVLTQPSSTTETVVEQTNVTATNSAQTYAGWPTIEHALLDDDPDPIHSTAQQDAPTNLEHITESIELSATQDEIATFDDALHDDKSAATDNDRILIEAGDFEDSKLITDSHEADRSDTNNKALDEITRLTAIAENKSSYFDDLAALEKSKTKQMSEKSRRWLWLLSNLVLFIIIVLQSIYFLRNEIATYYPQFKPYLETACLQINCSIALPQQIQWIIIDDSDMQEDANQRGIMHLTSSLMNKAAFNQAYPNIQLTLTDTDDKPISRRIFRPHEYLPTSTDLIPGFAANSEVKIKLSISTPDIGVAGYRLYVSYD